jgi:hypothetical protein
MWTNFGGVALVMFIDVYRSHTTHFSFIVWEIFSTPSIGHHQANYNWPGDDDDDDV